MTNNLNPEATNRRKQARQTDGKFGHQHYSEADVSLGVDDHAAEQRRRLEMFADGHDQQWHQDFINDDILTLRDVPDYSWDVNDPMTWPSSTTVSKSLIFICATTPKWTLRCGPSSQQPHLQLWRSDKDDRSRVKVSDQDLLEGLSDHDTSEDAYTRYAEPDSFFAGDADGRHQPELNNYTYYGGDYDFVHASPPAGMGSVATSYDDPNSNWVESSYERYNLDEWMNEHGYEYEVAEMTDPSYRRAVYEYNTITQQRRQPIDFFDDEDLVNRLAEES